IFRKDLKKPLDNDSDDTYDNSSDNDSGESELDEGFFSKLSFGSSKRLKFLKDEDEDFKDEKDLKPNKINAIGNKKRKKKPSRVIPWTKAEEGQLMQAIETHGTKWSMVRESMGCKRAAYCYQSHWNVMKKRL
ncbi:8593_t:CDS:1, partial [Racocetra persica]